MPSMSGDSYGFCRAPDGRMIPCNQPPGNGLAQLAMMLRGSGWLDRDYAGSGNAVTDTYQSQSANTPRPAYENSWAAMPSGVGQYAGNNRPPITPAEFFLPSMADPWIETIPYGARPWIENTPVAPEFRPFPPMPDEISPLPFGLPDLLKGNEPLGKPLPDPDDPECEKERQAADIFCAKQMEKLSQGLGDKGFGLTFGDCVLGQVSERCGGRPVNRGKPKRVKRWNLEA
jgi:hypothetical protein